MNPMAFLSLKPKMVQFRERHPKFVQFFSYAGSHLAEDSLVEISITDAEGKKIVTNIRLSAEDLELFREMQGMLHS